MTLNYLIRDLFVDDTGSALIPTLNKASILNQRSNSKDDDNMKYELDKIDAERDGRLKEFEKQNAKRKEAINKRFKEKTSALPTPDSEGETEEDDIN